MSNRGYVRLYRSIWDNWVWPKYALYWIDLIMLVMHSDTTYEFYGSPIPVRRAEYVTTQRCLAKRWGRSASWVNKFLKRLESDQMVRLETIRIPRSLRTQARTQGGTRITLVNYNRYQWMPDQPRETVNAGASPSTSVKEAMIEEEAAPVSTEERPLELRAVLQRLCSITGRDVRWPADELQEMIGLAHEVPWTRILTRVEEIASRQVKKRDIPRSLRYYIKVISEDEAPRHRDELNAHVVEPPRGIGDGDSTGNHPRSSSYELYRPGKRTEPKLETGYRTFVEAGKRLSADEERELPH